MSSAAISPTAIGPGATLRALDHLFDEYDRARAEKDKAEIRLRRFVDTIHALIDGLPPSQRDDYQRRFSELKEGLPTRGGELFGNVISLLHRHPFKVWTVPEVQEALKQKGQEADEAKAVSNAVAYLAKSGRLRRVARGQYMIRAGAGIEAEGYEDGTSRRTEHDF